jgi:hypothetical protein
MNIKSVVVLFALCLFSFMACSQKSNTVKAVAEEDSNQKNETVKSEPHRYGGWYCPDNLNGFPAVDINDWEKVPVVNGRMPSQEETQSGVSLIYVDVEKYPNAKPLDMKMPKLASFYSDYTKREEIIIVIQAVNVDNDSIIGFRYLNGGNGSARLNEVKFLKDSEIDKIPNARFVSHNITINATQDVIWNVLTNPENATALQPAFDPDNKLGNEWRESANVNYFNPNAALLTSSYAEKLFGNFYIQNDFHFLNYNEKFLLLEDQETKQTTLKIVCGPYADDYEKQKQIINAFAQKVKALSEKGK